MVDANPKTAFVLMPFDREFDSIYKDFVKPTLEGKELVVSRADDLESHQNILRDVVESIYSSDIIIADLTSLNANVFYELGIAHTLNKVVILLTQNIDEVPFDLKGYRLLEYSTHFSAISKAKEELERYAQDFCSGSLLTGNPVSDFSPSDIAVVNVTKNGGIGRLKVEADDRGFVDHLLDLNSGYERIAEIATGMTEDMKALNQHTEDAAADFVRIGEGPGAASPEAARRIARRFAEKVSSFNSRMSAANEEYEKVAQETEGSLEFIVSFQLEQGREEDPSVKEQLESLGNLQVAAVGGRDACLGLADKMASLPRIERRLNREVTRGSEELRVMAGNLDKTVASISRALRE